MHVLVVIVLQPAVMVVIMLVAGMVAIRACVIMVMMMVVMIMIMVMIVIIRLKEGGFDLQDALEIEGPAVENFIERRVGLLRLQKPRIGVDGAGCAPRPRAAPPPSQDRSC